MGPWGTFWVFQGTFWVLWGTICVPLGLFGPLGDFFGPSCLGTFLDLWLTFGVLRGLQGGSLDVFFQGDLWFPT